MMTLKDRIAQWACALLATAPLWLFLSGCTDAQMERFANAMLALLAIILVVMIVGLIISALWTIFGLVVTILNFTRPSRWTMVTGFLLGGLEVLGSMFTAAAAVQVALEGGAAGGAASGDGLMSMIGAMIFGLIFGGVKIASSVYALRKLNAADLP